MSAFPRIEQNPAILIFAGLVSASAEPSRHPFSAL